jgi:hypothetical protein
MQQPIHLHLTKRKLILNGFFVQRSIGTADEIWRQPCRADRNSPDRRSRKRWHGSQGAIVSATPAKCGSAVVELMLLLPRLFGYFKTILISAMSHYAAVDGQIFLVPA